MTQFAKKIKLTNGLTVIFEKNDNADIVSIQVGVKVGSVDEEHHESGICHLIEHMVFKGTTSFAPGEIATLVESHGGELNAYTSLDQTVYYITIPSKHFKLGLKLIKEMVYDAKFDELELEREKEVVVEEIRRGQDNPQRVLGETLFSNFFKSHPYGRPVIGTDKHVYGFSRDKVANFYKKHYVPSNMILAVCGNINENELSKELEDLLRDQKSLPLHKPHIKPEPQHKKSKIVLNSMDINATYFDVAFQAPNIKHKDVPALDVLSHLLGESDTSLLEQNTKEQEQLVHSIYSSCYTPKHPGLFMIGGLVDPKKINQALVSIKEQVEWTQKHVFEQEKLERSKLLAKSQLIYEQQTCEGTARKWITYETTASDYRFDESYIEAISQLTPEDIQTVAQKYLNFETATFVVLHPTKTKISVKKELFKKAPKKNSRSFKKTKTHKQAAIYKLDNGIRVVLKENHRLPLVSIKTASLGGLRYETTQNNGINQLLSNVVTRGTQNLSQVALAEKCEWLSANLGGYTGRNSFGLSFSFLSEKLHQAIPVLTDVMLNPAFDDESEIKKERALQIESIKNREDNLSYIVFRQVLQKVFSGHPYERQLLGTPTSVRKLSGKTLKQYYQKIMTPKNVVMACVGDFDSQDLLERLNVELAELKVAKFEKKSFKKPKPIKGITRLFTHKNKKQAHIAIGFLGTSIHDEDRHTLELINNILSGQGGRLFLELRDKMSLAYTVSSTMIEGLETGFFGAYIGTDPSKVKTAISGILNEFEKIQTKLISTEELERAKNYIIGNHEIDHQKNSAIALQLALNEAYGQGLDDFFQFQKHVKRITKKDVLRVAQKYLTLNNYVIGVVGPKGCN